MKTAAKDFKMTELGPIPKDWEVKRLGDCCSITTGHKDVNEGCENGQFPFFTCSRDIHRANCYSFDGEAILVAGNGDVGNLHYCNGKFEAYQRTYVLMNFKVAAQYLWCELGANLMKRLTDGKIGTSIPYIVLGQLQDYTFALPPLSEQRKIAAALSDVDEMIAALEKLIEKKRKIKTGAMQRLLTAKTRLPGFKGAWVEKRLGECGYGVRGVGYKPWQSGFTPMVGRVSLLKSNNVQDGRLNFNDIVYVDECCVSEEQRMRVGDVLICAANGSRNLVGKAAPLLVEREVTFGAFMSVFRCHDNDQAAFVGHLLNSGAYKQKLDDILTGSAINNLNVSDIEDMRFLIPPTLAEQKAIAKVLGDMDEEIAALEAELAKTRQLKQGMMQELLTGKTRLI